MLERNAMRVLLADDNAEVRWLVARALRKEGWTVIEVSDGEELARALEQPDIGLVVTDVRMPRKTGLEVAIALRARESHVPLILITGFPDAQTRRQARELDALLFEKPFRVETLRMEAVRLVSGAIDRSA